MPETKEKQSTVKTVTLVIDQIKKRDGSIVPFDVSKTSEAAYKAMQHTGEGSKELADEVAKAVYSELLSKKVDKGENYIPEVEEVQDLVEKHLIYKGLALTSKAYILYRLERAQARESSSQISPELKELTDKSSSYFNSTLAELVYYRTYSRWNDELGRRETWMETVQRFMDFMKENLGKKLKESEYKEIHAGILNMEIVPSMRLMWSSGPAARKTNVCAYNCSYVAPTRPRDLGEIMYISMCGAGLGFSVESQTAQEFPLIKKQTGKVLKHHVVGDSKEGWAEAFIHGLETWFNGKDVQFDYSKVRPSGARLKTMGGRASGHDPLQALLEFSREKILSKQGKRLSNLDLHDIICKIGEIVVAGGVRRSAMISLSDLDDHEMRHAKDGQFYLSNTQRSMANNSAIYNEKPTASVLLDEWTSLIRSNSGERGIWNRGAIQNQLTDRRWKKFKDYSDTSGVNPCGEIILRSKQFCNLSGIVVRSTDTKKSLLNKIRLASILGTYQASLTDFKFLSPEWKKNCEEEALLGVSLTGYYDNKIVRSDKILRDMRDLAVEVNKKYSKKFGINPSTAVTCVKPSGNSSQLLDTASGMHPRYSQYYIRRVRISATDPLLRMLVDQGVPAHPEVGQTETNATTWVLDFPVESPKDAVLKDDISALDLLDEWKRLKLNFTEHNPSATIYVGEDEWIQVANWVFENWEIIGGLSFLPRTNHVYHLAPYEEIDEKKYKELSEKVKDVDFSKLFGYESTDHTEGAKEYACVAGACDI